MPRFAFALRRPSADVGVLRAAAQAVLGDQASAHKAFLLDRGIVRERVWAQTGAGTPPLVLVLWDCDDVEEALQRNGGHLNGGQLDRSTPHERWLHDVVGGPAAPPGRPQLLSGTTVRATDVGSVQTLVAVPLPPAAQEGARRAIARLEDGDLADANRALLGSAGIREEWIWLQPPGGGLGSLLLIHWIVDDPSTAWQVIGQHPHPAADLLRRDVLGAGHITAERVAGWTVEQLWAMHVRRSDSGDPPVGRLAARLELGLSRGRWESLTRACRPQVQVDGVAMAPSEALARVRQVVGEDGAPVIDTLVGSAQVLVVLSVDGQDLAVLATVRQGLVDGLDVLPAWPPTRGPGA